MIEDITAATDIYQWIFYFYFIKLCNDWAITAPCVSYCGPVMPRYFDFSEAGKLDHL